MITHVRARNFKSLRDVDVCIEWSNMSDRISTSTPGAAKKLQHAGCESVLVERRDIKV